jgi:hypothetical protein
MTTFKYLLPVLAFVTACSSTTLNNHETNKIIYVSAQQAPCVGVVPMMCLQVRERINQPWQLQYDVIEGFEFQAGSEYRLRITEIQVNNPPADSSSVRWVLKEILDKHKTDGKVDGNKGQKN